MYSPRSVEYFFDSRIAFAFSFISARHFFPSLFPPLLVGVSPRDPSPDCVSLVSHRHITPSVLAPSWLVLSPSLGTCRVLMLSFCVGLVVIFCILSSFVVCCQIIAFTCSRLFFENIHPLYFGIHFPPASFSCSFIAIVSPFTTNAFSDMSSI